MVFHNRMLDTVIDQFGKEVWLSKVDDWHFRVTFTVAVSPHLSYIGFNYGYRFWNPCLLGIGRCETVSPNSTLKDAPDNKQETKK